jgi:hypothetical protein
MLVVIHHDHENGKVLIENAKSADPGCARGSAPGNKTRVCHRQLLLLCYCCYYYYYLLLLLLSTTTIYYYYYHYYYY